MRQPILFLLLLLLITSCTKLAYVDKYTLTDNIIIDGQGIGSFEINHTTAKDVIKKLGRQFDEIKHNEHSVQMLYKDLGMSFYYYQKDETKKIFSVIFSEPFTGRTSKGIVLRQSTMEDVVRLYGEPDWTTCDNCDTWTSEYEGVQFSVERDKSLPQFPLDEEVHLRRKIIEIEVTLD
jgi:hypothetical protein